jgi:hypothetical protein
MADWANINAPSLVPAATPTTNTANTGGDRFQAQFGAKYMVRWNNTGGAPITVTVDDPVSVSPASATAFNPDVPVTVTNAQQRMQTIDANRFRDSNGWINFTYSGTPTMTAEIHGPL